MTRCWNAGTGITPTWRLLCAGWAGLSPWRTLSATPNTIQVNINSLPPDGIEVRSVNTRSERESEIRKIATRLHLATLQNSDAHSVNPIGRYFNVLPDFNDGDAGLIATLMGLKEKT